MTVFYPVSFVPLVYFRKIFDENAFKILRKFETKNFLFIPKIRVYIRENIFAEAYAVLLSAYLAPSPPPFFREGRTRMT